MEIVKKHNSGHVWKRFKLTSTRKANAKKCLHCVWQRKRVIISSNNLYSLEYESIGRNCSFDENLVALELDYPLKDRPNGLAKLLDYGRDGFMYCERSEEGNDEFPVMMKIPFFWFNPSITESKRILDPPPNFVPNDWSVYCFSFNFVKDDYKVVKVGCGTICVY
ncbi:hypothetical protein Goarm_003632 [Gossypium armourianum]|uniref:Uncharacterized protein n=1 Tax=Gossypium armourianum TaxID=34283 RepID=A0A7J9K4B2_9ROSI|nr:hypothetical protein [Gossypium armourianum]